MGCSEQAIDNLTFMPAFKNPGCRVQIDGEIYQFTTCKSFVHILIFIVTVPRQVWLGINAGMRLGHFIAVVGSGKAGA